LGGKELVGDVSSATTTYTLGEGSCADEDVAAELGRCYLQIRGRGEPGSELGEQ